MAISELMATRPDTVCSVCALITLKPNQPMHSSHEPMASQGIEDGGMPTVLALVVAAEPRAQPSHGGEGEPAAHGVHDDGAGEVVELLAEPRP